MAAQIAKVDAVLKSCYGGFAAVGAFSIFINLLALTLPLYMMQIFQRVGSSKSIETLISLTVIAICALLLSALLEIVRGNVLVSIGTKIDVGLTDSALREAIQGAGGAAGSPQTLRDLQEMRSFLSGPGVIMLFDALWVPVFIGVIYLVHPILGDIAVAGTIAMLGVAFLNDVLTRQSIRAAGEAAGAALGGAAGFARNSDTINAMGMLPSLTRRWQHHHWRSLNHMADASLRVAFLSALAAFVRRILQILLLAAGMYLVIEGDLTFGPLMAVSLIFAQGMRPVEVGIGMWRNAVSAHTSFQRVRQTLGHAPNRRRDGMSMPAPAGRLQTDRLIYTPPGQRTPILKGISFSVEPGQIFGIIGPSGAGKSTLARLIVGAIRPTAGSMRIDGFEVTEWNPDELGRFVGYLPQDVQLFAASIRDNIARMAPDPVPEAVIDAAQRAGLHEQILQMPHGYDTYINDGGIGLSGGQKQLLGLARALYSYPKILILDEPNANLDDSGESALIEAMKGAQSLGTTIVLITHRPKLLASADQILVLVDGSMQMLGPRNKVLGQYGRRAPAPQNSTSGSVHFLGETQGQAPSADAGN